MADGYTFAGSMAGAARCALASAYGSAVLAVARVQIRLAPAWMRPALQEELDRTQHAVEATAVQAMWHLAEALMCAADKRWA